MEARLLRVKRGLSRRVLNFTKYARAIYFLVMRAASRRRNILFSMRHYGGFIYTYITAELLNYRSIFHARKLPTNSCSCLFSFSFISFKYYSMSLISSYSPRYFRPRISHLFALSRKLRKREVRIGTANASRHRETKSQAKKTWACQIGNA